MISLIVTFLSHHELLKPPITGQYTWQICPVKASILQAMSALQVLFLKGKSCNRLGVIPYTDQSPKLVYHPACQPMLLNCELVRLIKLELHLFLSKDCMYQLHKSHTGRSFVSIGHYTKLSYQCGWRVDAEIFNAGHSYCLVCVESMWDQDPGSSPKSSEDLQPKGQSFMAA